MSRQVFTARFLAAAFKSSSDATLADINVKAFVDAATGAYPAWFPYVVTARFVLAALGSLLIIILLAVPSVNASFH
jgi:hypothetical protein